MLLTITTTATPATDLGFLLHKHPGKVQEFDVTVGRAHVFYPEATDRVCTAVLLVEVDPVELVRGRRPGGADGFSLAQYVNDRPYAASSMLAVAISRVFRSAMAGRCAARPELPDRPLPLDIHVPALPCAGGAEIAVRLFAPLGWQVRATPLPLDPAVPDWGDSRYVDLRLTGELRLADALNHLYVLLPVLDNAKHYWIGIDEVEKLIRAGEGWLGTHPDRELITRRYLAHRRELVATAVGRLTELDDRVPEEPDDEPAPRPLPLVQQRIAAVLAALGEAGAARVVDLGCGEGALIRALLAEPAFREVLGVDVSHRALEIAARRLRLERLGERQRERVRLVQSSLTYRDERIAGFDAAVLMEVVEHVDPPRLPALERAVFGAARPSTVVVTTPNVEYNIRFEGLQAGAMRHRDHRFEWTRGEFRAWAGGVAAAHGYRVRYVPVGPDDPEVGPPTQMAVFALEAS
ncbi:3' terminal RNA ribose 2'-O-methyltransferase Hen1 [Dactylosporangium sp. CS-047395]|uniref:3' terminal RNA ribose 2'-O-methyltransferase Hen1 n=1 Tax=Dactylosporangium sp. CS-047395 TaxID=3239936 RepID=UPI003D89B645